MTAAMPHVGKRLVINIDVKEFFPSVKRDTVIAFMEKQLDEDDPLIKKVAKWCFVPVGKEKVKYRTPEEQIVWGLPQGAPTSPFLSNLALMNTDWRIARYVLKNYENSDYTRYADDLTVSSDDENVRTVIGVIDGFLGHLGMVKNEKKLRIMRPHRRQDVCGIVVNEKLNLPRKYRKLLRAMKHQGNFSTTAMGHYSYHHSVYEIDYEPEHHKTKTIINSWMVQKRMSPSVEDDE